MQNVGPPVLVSRCVGAAPSPLPSRVVHGACPAACGYAALTRAACGHVARHGRGTTWHGRYVGGTVYFNVWQTDFIGHFDLRRGCLLRWLDLRGLKAKTKRRSAKISAWRAGRGGGFVQPADRDARQGVTGEARARFTREEQLSSRFEGTTWLVSA